MRRFIHVALTAVSGSVLAVGLLAGPALAAEEESHGEETTEEHADEGDDHADEGSEGFGSGQWDGLIMAAGAAAVMGGLAFASSGPGQIGKDQDHH